MQLRLSLLIIFYLSGAILAEDLLELSCATDEECENFENAKCINSSCICLARGSDTHVECHPKYDKVTNIIGGPCPCTQPNAYCDNETKQCFCVAGYIPSEDKRRCLSRNVPLDGKCEQSRQCEMNNTFAVCHTLQQRCMCKEHYEPHLGNCRAILDLSCSNDKHCSSSGSSLCLPKLEKCVCELNLVQNPNKTVCIPAAAYGQRCFTTSQCQQVLGVGGYCKANQCTCRPKYYASGKPNTTNLEANNTICEPVVSFGAYCRSDQDCHHKNQLELKHSNSTMQCKWGECHCREYHQVDNEICVPLPSAANQMLPFLPQIFMIFAIVCVSIL